MARYRAEQEAIPVYDKDLQAQAAARWRRDYQERQGAHALNQLTLIQEE